MKTIMVDMDDVITYGRFTHILENYLGYKPNYKSLKGYYVQDLLGEKKEDFFSKFKEMNLYENAHLLPHCYEVLKKLSKSYEIYICTDYIWPEITPYAGRNLKNKYDFLYQKLDFLNPRHFVFLCNKELLNCDIKIDDKIENTKGAQTRFLFTAYHNKKITEDELKKENVIRVNNWKDIEKYLLHNNVK